MTLDDLQFMCCLIWKVLCVCVTLMWFAKVPSWQVLHLLSPHRWNTAFVVLLVYFLCVSDICINFPFRVLNTLPHCSHVLLFLSISTLVELTMLLLGGSLRLTNMSFRFRLRLNASSGGCGKTFLQRSLVRRTGCNCFSLFFKSGTIGLYVVENITLSQVATSRSFGLRSSRVSADAFQIPSLIRPSL